MLESMRAVDGEMQGPHHRLPFRAITICETSDGRGPLVR